MDSGFHTAVVNSDHLWIVTQRQPEIRSKRCRSLFKSGYSLTKYEQKGARWSQWASDEIQCHPCETVPGIKCLPWKRSVWEDFRRCTLPNIYNGTYVMLYHSLTVSQSLNPSWFRDLQPLPLTMVPSKMRSTLHLNIRLHLLSTKSWQDDGCAVAVLGTQHKNKCLFFWWKAYGMTRRYKEK